MNNYVSRQPIFYRSHKLNSKGFPIFNAGKVITQKGDEVFIRIKYQVNLCAGRLKVFWTNPKHKDVSWVRQPKVEHLKGNCFSSEEEMHKAIAEEFGMTFEEISGGCEKKVTTDFSLPTIPRRASLETIINIIESSTVRYCTGVLLSNEAIVMAIANKPENAHLIVQLEQAKKYFRGIPALGVAA